MVGRQNPLFGLGRHRFSDAPFGAPHVILDVLRGIALKRRHAGRGVYSLDSCSFQLFTELFPARGLVSFVFYCTVPRLSLPAHFASPPAHSFQQTALAFGHHVQTRVAPACGECREPSELVVGSR